MRRLQSATLEAAIKGSLPAGWVGEWEQGKSSRGRTELGCVQDMRTVQKEEEQTLPRGKSVQDTSRRLKRAGSRERERQQAGGWEHSKQGLPSWSRSRLLQLDISNVEASHVLVGALEAPGDVLIHGAVIEVQALGRKQNGGPQCPDAWVPAPSQPCEDPHETLKGTCP